MKLSHFIDHTLLKPEATEKDIEKLCGEAAQFGFYTVCIQPSWVASARGFLAQQSVKIATVVGFPLGANTTFIKMREAEEAIENGADEIDMVIHIGKLKEENYSYIAQEIRGLKEIAHNQILKVIVETCLLTELEKVNICKLAIDSGADFIKTSTGFSTGGAKVEDVILFNSISNGKIRIKASGGITDSVTAVRMIEAGATRLGTSRSVSIVTGIPLTNTFNH